MAQQNRDVIAGEARLFEGQLLCGVDGSQTLTPTPRLSPRLQRCQVSRSPRSGCDNISLILTLLTTFTPDRQQKQSQLLYPAKQQPDNNSVVM